MGKRRVAGPSALVVGAGLLLSGCSGSTAEPPLDLEDAQSTYAGVLEDVAAALQRAYPDATVVANSNDTPSVGLQDDGRCVLFLQNITVDIHVLMPDNRVRTVEAVSGVLAEHGFSELSDVQTAGGGWISTEAEDQHAATFLLRAKNQSELSLSATVTSPDCSLS